MSSETCKYFSKFNQTLHTCTYALTCTERYCFHSSWTEWDKISFHLWTSTPGLQFSYEIILNCFQSKEWQKTLHIIKHPLLYAFLDRPVQLSTVQLDSDDSHTLLLSSVWTGPCSRITFQRHLIVERRLNNTLTCIKILNYGSIYCMREKQQHKKGF